jgi:hypothetical protein
MATKSAGTISQTRVVRSIRENGIDWLLAIALVGGAWVALAYAGSFDSLVFDPQALMNLGNVLAPLVVISAFIERSVEVVLTPIRGDRSERLLAKIREDEKKGDDTTHEQDALRRHKQDTRRIAFGLAIGLGLVSSLVGVRALSNLVTTPTNVPDAVSMLDVLLTGLLLGGGAEGIHKIVKVFTSYTDLITKKNEDKKHESDSGADA